MNDLTQLLAELTGGDDERAEASISSLAAHGEAALRAARPLLEDPDPDIRWWAVRLLAEISSPKTPRLLLRALGDQEVTVRQCAALGLRRQPLEQAIPDLIAALGSQDYLLSNLAGDALIAIGSPAVPALLEIMQHGVQAARLVAIRALAMIGDHRSIPVLFEALSETSAMIEYWADEGLQRMGVGTTLYRP